VTSSDNLVSVIEEYSLATVQEYMIHIRNNAELAVRNLLRTVAARQSSPQAVLHAIDYMDDGTPIGTLSLLTLIRLVRAAYSVLTPLELTVSIDSESGTAVFDFEGESFHLSLVVVERPT
jgi:N-methylhydantoinase B/oxoprolinase/acetone carboxylase alpha subunit